MKSKDRATVFRLFGDDEVLVLRMPIRTESLLSSLTATEIAVVRLVCAGMTNAQIADRRGCSRRTIANHLASIFRKLSVGSRHELIAFVATTGVDD